jgi:hypothetical protein
VHPKYPRTSEALRIARLFNRKPTTPWTDKEIRRFRALKKAGCFQGNEFELIEKYYAAERKKPDGIHRRDLFTFLNNYSGELDRARARAIRLEGIRSRKPLSPRPPELTDEQIERNRAMVKAEVEKLRARMRLPACERIIEEAVEIFNGTRVSPVSEAQQSSVVS